MPPSHGNLCHLLWVYIPEGHRNNAMDSGMHEADLPYIVEHAQAGDLKAFELLVRRFQDMAYAYAFSLLGDGDLAREAAQESFIETYRVLGQLRNRTAFPSWFRRIVFKHCDRILRDRVTRAVGLDEEACAGPEEHLPDRQLEKRELRRTVVAAIRSLPEHQRETTALFYMNGYSHNEVADFLEVPVSTVKKRLHDARKNLKETLMDTLKDALREHAPDERFPRKVIDELTGRPRLLEIPGHPVRAVWDCIRNSLPDWQIVSGEETTGTTLYPSIDDHLAEEYKRDGYRTGDGEVLRVHTTHTAFEAIRGRMPPVRILTAGRVFRQVEDEDERHMRVFHQVDGVYVGQGSGAGELRAVCARVVAAVLGPLPLRWHDSEFSYVNNGMEFAVQIGGEWVDVGGCGLLKPGMLAEAGFESDQVGGYAFGLGLERLAMAKSGIGDIRELWRAPYVE
jgi:RNA polymerase sigma factor (sigma-70 family)